MADQATLDNVASATTTQQGGPGYAGMQRASTGAFTPSPPSVAPHVDVAQAAHDAANKVMQEAHPQLKSPEPEAPEARLRPLEGTPRYQGVCTWKRPHKYHRGFLGTAKALYTRDLPLRFREALAGLRGRVLLPLLAPGR